MRLELRAHHEEVVRHSLGLISHIWRLTHPGHIWGITRHIWGITHPGHDLGDVLVSLNIVDIDEDLLPEVGLVVACILADGVMEYLGGAVDENGPVDVLDVLGQVMEAGGVYLELVGEGAPVAVVPLDRGIITLILSSIWLRESVKTFLILMR